MQDRRTSPRGRKYIGGQIVFNGRCSTLDYLIRNLSEGGAMLDVSGAIGLPRDFEIVVRGAVRRARLIWSTATRAGIAFAMADGAPSPTAGAQLADA